jgi:hypothetical protein
LTPQVAGYRIRRSYFAGPLTGVLPRVSALAKLAAIKEVLMQYLPGFTVQCINPLCEARGHWQRVDPAGPMMNEGRCPCCGDFLQTVPPPLTPRFRMRPRPLTARPPLRPRPR